MRHFTGMLFRRSVTTSCEQENFENSKRIARCLRQLRMHKTDCWEIE